MKNDKYFRVEVVVDSSSMANIKYTAETSQYFFVRTDEDGGFDYDIDEIKAENLRYLKTMVAKIKDWSMIDINVQSGSMYGNRVLLDSYRALKDNPFNSEYKISGWDGYRFSWDNEPLRKNLRPLFTLLGMCLQKAHELYLEEQNK